MYVMKKLVHCVKTKVFENINECEQLRTENIRKFSPFSKAKKTAIECARKELCNEDGCSLQ